MNIRKCIYDIISPGKEMSAASIAFACTINVLILISVVIVFASTFDLPEGVLNVMDYLELTASTVFTVEYALRILTADLKYPRRRKFTAVLRYICSPLAIVDLAAVLPFWLPMVFPDTMLGIRSLRLIMLLRVFKLNRYYDAMKFIGEVIVSKQRELLGSFFFLSVLMMLSSLLMYSAEHDAQPDVFQNAFSGLWWAVATLTTVGYGDIYPITVVGKLLGAVIAFSGIAALAIPTGIITSGLTERISLGKEVNAELSRQRTKDDEHDRLLREQSELLKKIAEKLSRL